MDFLQEFAALGLLCSLLDLLSRILGVPLLHSAIIQGSTSYVAARLPVAVVPSLVKGRAGDRTDNKQPYFGLAPMTIGAPSAGITNAINGAAPRNGSSGLFSSPTRAIRRMNSSALQAVVTEGDAPDSLDMGIGLLEQSAACLVDATARSLAFDRDSQPPFVALAMLCRRLTGEAMDVAAPATSLTRPSPPSSLLAQSVMQLHDVDDLEASRITSGEHSWELIPHAGMPGVQGPTTVAVLSSQANAAAAVAVSRFRDAVRGMWEYAASAQTR